MLKLNLSETYKSLAPFEIELPNFSILTGLNGAGKTHILEGIKEKQIAIQLEDGIYPEEIAYANTHTLIPQQAKVLPQNHLASSISTQWQTFVQVQNSLKANKATNPDVYLSGSNYQIIRETIANTGKDILEITHADFLNAFPVDNGASEDFFYQKFTDICYRYSRKYNDNEFQEFLKENKGVQHAVYLDKEAFVRKNGVPPWEFVNEMIETAQFDFLFVAPTGVDRDSNFSISIVKKITNLRIDFSQLSSGEKTILSLALALYNSHQQRTFPKLLLLDEPDASLHPSMSKVLIDVLTHFFVESKGISVIMTSHSASTIALAPEDSLYLVAKSASPAISKQSKDATLKALCAGVPSFSVNYENRRQVFVENQYDAVYYEGIYNIISAKLNPEISLTFISSGASQTNSVGIGIESCEQVKKICGILKESGNKFISGIIDFDNKNKAVDNIFVIGNGERYSIENFIFDPLLVVALLLREKLANSQGIGGPVDKTYLDLKELNRSDLQNMVFGFTDLILNRAKIANRTLVEVRYASGLSLQVPNEYLLMQGHELENWILQVFPKLDEIRKKKEDLLKLEVIQKVMTDYPEFIPEEFIRLFLEIQGS